MTSLRSFKVNISKTELMVTAPNSTPPGPLPLFPLLVNGMTNQLCKTENWVSFRISPLLSYTTKIKFTSWKHLNFLIPFLFYHHIILLKYEISEILYKALICLLTTPPKPQIILICSREIFQIILSPSSCLCLHWLPIALRLKTNFCTKYIQPWVFWFSLPISSGLFCTFSLSLSLPLSF